MVMVSGGRDVYRLVRGVRGRGGHVGHVDGAILAGHVALLSTP